jgi:glycosyltransferase involved in cell wall biosynthesis
MSIRNRVAVNLTWCIPGVVGGSEEYLCRQLVGVGRAGVGAVVFAPRGFTRAHPELLEHHEIVEARHDCQSRQRRMLLESTWLHRRTRGSLLVHHGGGTLPVLVRKPTLLTIHDLQYLQFPQYFSRQRLTYLRAIMPRSAVAANLIAVPTEFVKRTVVDAFGVEADRIVVVPHGVDESLGDDVAPEAELRERFALGDDPILVLPAVTHPHKGHLFLIDVADRHWSHQGFRLVLMGGSGAADSAVRQRLQDPRVSRWVTHVGRVPDRDRNGLLSMARALVFPSEYEGFGAPVIEAMQLGVPVVTSDRTCLPEVVADAGIVLSLQEDLWAAVPDLVGARRSELIERGGRRVADFSVSASGDALAKAYRMVAS